MHKCGKQAEREREGGRRGEERKRMKKLRKPNWGLQRCQRRVCLYIDIPLGLLSRVPLMAYILTQKVYIILTEEYGDSDCSFLNLRKILIS